jgi:hypothetical protein
MPKTQEPSARRASDAERMREWRRKNLQGGDSPMVAMSMNVSVTAKAKLARLARWHGVSQKEMFERLVAEAERSLVGPMSGEDDSRYYAPFRSHS